MLSLKLTIATEKFIDKSTMILLVIAVPSLISIASLRARLECTIVLEMTENRLEMIAMQS